jgi:hypothetical protein
MSDDTRSERACPVCGEHRLKLEEPPRIDIMGVQVYSDMLGMGDLQQESLPSIVCLACGTRWRDLRAFQRNEPEPREEAATPDDGPAAGPDHAPAETETAGDPEPPDGAASARRP